MRKTISVILILIVALICTACKKENKNTISFFDSDGNAFAEYGEKFALADMSYSSFAEIALNEAVSDIAKLKNISDEKALEFLKNNTYIKTTFNSSLTKNSTQSLKDFTDEDFGFAVTDLKGGLVSCGSSSVDNNYAYTPTFIGSTVKPLSVYAPGMEKGILNWSTVQRDEPYKTLEESGQSWPANANGIYTNEDISVCNAVINSVNTIAVKWLKELGINNSMDFLEKNFGINLDSERDIMVKYSEEEILGDLALGYLKSGVTVCDMAGYYSVFANGGNYTKPYTVSEIYSSDGKIIYKYNATAKKVLSDETAYIMNELLQKVVSNMGTGANAYIEGARIGGKTGTTDNNDDNWFVGFNPEYSCGVWHGNKTSKSNIAPELFKTVMEPVVSSNHSEYPKCGNVANAIYCGKSGMLLSDKCLNSEVGFYPADKLPEICNKCK